LVHKKLRLIISDVILSYVRFFTAPRNASAVYFVVVCPSVRPSVRPSQSGFVSKPLDESSWVLALKLPSTYPILCYMEIWISPKIRVLGTSLWNFVPNAELRTFRHGKSIALSTELVDGRAY